MAFSQQMLETQVSLEVDRQEVIIQLAKIPELESRIGRVKGAMLLFDDLDSDTIPLLQDSTQMQTLERKRDVLLTLKGQIVDKIIKERLARQNLESKVSELQTKYDAAAAARYSTTNLGTTLYTSYQLTTIREPSLPDSPISPQKGRNITISTFLGLVLGAMAALLLSYYRSKQSQQPTSTI
jgi:LPS O-antigen subunit length determinant protein (WzzB/FepE family)